MNPVSGNALVFTLGLLDQNYAKTAHGLIRGSDRFTIKAVIDPVFAGQEAGEILDGRNRNIPVYTTIDEALKEHRDLRYAMVGIAPVGGKLPKELLDQLKHCAQKGLSIISGLHEYVSDKPEIAEAAARSGSLIIDIRKPKPKSELHFWTGRIYQVKCPIVAILGMDCAIGKRSTTRFLMEACQKEGIRAEMIFTGQTGWMQSGRYGFVLDSTYNDFVSGELEHAIVSCWEEQRPDILFLEGQSALRNPSGPCGSELLISGQAKYTILLYAPKRIYFDDNPAWGKIPSLQSEIELIRSYDSQVIGIALNTTGCTREEALRYQETIKKEIKLPVCLPVETGVGELMPAIRSVLNL